MVDEPRAPSVLLVEHGQDCRWFWRMAIDGDPRFGPVLEVGSMTDALDLLTREYPDIVVADIPTCDGVDLLEYLKSRYPMPIVVATSTSADIADIARGCGATAFWTKAESLSPEMSENLWRLWEAENEECDGTDPNGTDAVQRGRRSLPDPSGRPPMTWTRAEVDHG